ncbi:hypothetical protein [Haloarcula montana]|uniref:hypothetical protein n=1 Tax=Haloarcula montana TaxID=3111776 RepID=UPI002D77CA43|nr:hypothetical protein [Haloarcula sp. GH36]
MRRFLVLLVGSALVVGVFSVGTGGFTAGQVERTATVGIVPDDRAALGYDARCRGDDLHATVTNRAVGAELVLSVSVSGTDRQVTVGPAESTTLRFGDVEPGTPVTVRAHTEDGGLAIELERSVPEDCRDRRAISWIAFCGTPPAAPPAVAATDGDGPTAVHWTDTGDGPVVYKAGPTVYNTTDDGAVRSGQGTSIGSARGDTGTLISRPCTVTTGSSGTKFEYNSSTGAFESGG